MKIIAHRGASGHAPENTFTAFQLAWEQGADGIELDIHLSQDGRIMVHHDTTTLRTGRETLVIADTCSSVLRELDVGSWYDSRFKDERIPFLEDVLAKIPIHGLVLIEIKSDPNIVPVLHTIISDFVALQPRIALISFELTTLLACQAALPLIPCYLVTACERTDGHNHFPEHNSGLITLAQRHKLAGLDPDYRGITAEFAASVHAAGLQLMTWTVNDPAAAKHMQAMGLAAITTDYPLEIRHALAP